MTSDLKKRVVDHKRGKTRSTKNRGRFSVVVIETCQNRVSARTREKHWKSGCGKEFLKRSGIEQSGSSSGS